MYCFQIQNHQLRIIHFIKQNRYIDAVYYAEQYMQMLNNIGKDSTLIAIFHILNRKVVAKQHITLCLKIYHKIKDSTDYPLYTEQNLEALLKSRL